MQHRQPRSSGHACGHKGRVRRPDGLCAPGGCSHDHGAGAGEPVNGEAANRAVWAAMIMGLARVSHLMNEGCVGCQDCTGFNHGTCWRDIIMGGPKWRGCMGSWWRHGNAQVMHGNAWAAAARLCCWLCLEAPPGSITLSLAVPGSVGSTWKISYKHQHLHRPTCFPHTASQL